jgi:hypothetical protein
MSTGYRRVKIKGHPFTEHRVIWKLHYGTEPPPYVDHRNTDKTDNRIANLRETTRRQNCHNSRLSKRNTSGFKGVHFNSRRNQFEANIRINGRLKFLGRYASGLAAHEAYCAAGRKFFGSYFNSGQ